MIVLCSKALTTHEKRQTPPTHTTTGSLQHLQEAQKSVDFIVQSLVPRCAQIRFRASVCQYASVEVHHCILLAVYEGLELSLAFQEYCNQSRQPILVACLSTY